MQPMTPLLYRVLERQQDTSDVFTLSLAPHNGAAITPFAAGQFNMLYVFGVGEIPISISGDPETGQPTLIHTTRAVGTVTKAMSQLKTNDVLGVRGPFGTSWPVLEAAGKDILLIAGGIGLAPLRPAIYQLIHHRAKFGKVVLLYGSRTPEDLLYKQEMIQWRDQHQIDIHVTVDNATGEWLGRVGFVTQLVRRAPFDPHDVMVMICGPEIMMRYTIQELYQRGVQDEAIFVTLERNMKCAIGLCGHCQMGPEFICKDGPVFRYDQVKHFFKQWEI